MICSSFQRYKFLFNIFVETKIKSIYTKLHTLIFVALFLIAPASKLLAWGETGHKIINRKAVDYFPAEMKDFRSWRDFLGEHASDPDIRRLADKSEAPRHFIDIDYYKEFLIGRMIENKDSLIAIYGDSTVTKVGLLPWATLETFNNLVKAFRERNRDKAMMLAADLGHYVADGHQPMHCVVDYNGQLTNQEGVHARYETEMVNRYADELENSFDSTEISLVKSPLDFIFGYIFGSNSVCDVLLDADLLATKDAGNTTSDEYYRIMWFRTKYITEVQFNKAAQDFAALVYTAWVEAGKPPYSELN
jgi:hypothetical protein